MKAEDRIQIKSLLNQLQSMNYINGDELEKLEKYYGVMNRPFEEVKLEILNFIEDRSSLDKLLIYIELSQLQSINYINLDELRKLEDYYSNTNRSYEEVQEEIMKFKEDYSSLEKVLTYIELSQLKDINYINNDQLKKLEKHYGSIKRPYKEVKEEIINFKQDRSALEKLLESLEKENQEMQVTPEIEKMNEMKLDLENIEEIKKGDVEYIKLHSIYPEDKTIIVKKGPSSVGTNAKELFKKYQQQYSINGENVDAATIFKQNLQENDFVIYQGDIDEILQDNIPTTEQKEKLKFLKKQPLLADKKITVSTDENIYVISSYDSYSQDISITIKEDYVNGQLVYKLEPLEGSSYSNDIINKINADIENELYKLQSTPKEELGKTKSLVKKPKKKPNGDDAFVNILYFIVVLGIAASFVLYKVLMIRLNG